MIFICAGSARLLAAARPRMTWKLFLVADTVAQVVQTVLSGTTRCRFTIHSRSKAAAAVEGGYWTIARQVLDLFDASCGFAGDSFRDWRNLDVERLLNYELGGEIIIAWCEGKRPTFSNDLA